MAKKRLISPKGSRDKIKREIVFERPHFDVDIDKFSEDHYGLYLIVSNTAKTDKERNHNRIYLDLKAQNEFFKYLPTEIKSIRFIPTYNKPLDMHVLTLHPNHKNLIMTIIKKIKRNEKRRYVRDLLYGLNHVLNIFENAKIKIPNNPQDFLVEVHQEYLKNNILNGQITIKTHKMNIGTTWAFIKDNFNKKLSQLPITESSQTILNNLVKSQDEQLVDEYENDKDEITLEMLFQLDYYSQIELENIIKRRKEYLKWIEELEENERNGKYFFSQANLLKTFYNHPRSLNIRKLYIRLHGEDPQLWNPYRKKDKGYVMFNGKIYHSKQALARHKELQLIAEEGMDLSINNEKMFAWWHFKLYPQYPLDKNIVAEYNIFKEKWRDDGAKSCGISLYDFLERITPSIYCIYPLFLRLLIDSDANTDTVLNMQIIKLSHGSYTVGVSHHNLRMLNSIKLRSNTITPAFISKGTFSDDCINFFSEWLKPVYDMSLNGQFLQYFSVYRNSLANLTMDSIKKLSPEYSGGNSNDKLFLNKYKIFKTNEKIKIDENGKKVVKLIKERVLKIQHSKIRAANLYKNYYIGFGEWKSAHVDKGHQSDSILSKNYQQYSWKVNQEHQIATTLLHIQNFVEGKVTDERLETAFKQPHCDCSDNLNPSFDGAPKINPGEICTSWRNCLTKCEHSKVIPEIHGPTIMAWKFLLEEEKDNFNRIEDWEKEYIFDYEAVKVVVNKLNPKNYELAQQKAYERMPFVRLMMMQTKQKRADSYPSLGIKDV